MSKSDMRIFAGNANPGLATEICKYLGVPLGKGEVSFFPDSEMSRSVKMLGERMPLLFSPPATRPTNILWNC